MTRVVICADVRLYSEGLRLLLEREPDIEVVATAGTPDEALAKVVAARPDLVLFDSALPEGVAGMQAIRRLPIEVKLVALGLPEVDREIIVCAEAGVSGYVTRGGSRADLLATIRSVARGEALCSPRVTARLLHRIATLVDERPRGDRSRLTPREMQIVRLIDEGLSNKEIAGRLCIEVPTVKSHVHSILEKLGARRRGEAAARLRATRRSSGPPALDPTV